MQTDEAADDQAQIEISVSDPKKVGDGMNAYMVYKVVTKVSELDCVSAVVAVCFSCSAIEFEDKSLIGCLLSRAAAIVHFSR